MPYSIIIPIYNEERTLDKLLKSLEQYSHSRNQILIINDGSIDGTKKILKKYDFINVLHLKKNYGKGIALKVGLNKAKNNKVIIYDGDLELETSGINKLMNLNRSKNINSLLGYRYIKIEPLRSRFDFGNFMFNCFFNLTRQSVHKDVLCCAKSFYKSDIPVKKLSSTGFDIDIEITNYLTFNSRRKIIPNIKINYSRRSFHDGKKLNIWDGYKILKRSFFSLF
jgi:dolichol-phosphate mannosyltransferase